MLYQQISGIYFPKHQTIHSYSTWPSTSEDFYIKNTRLEVQKGAFASWRQDLEWDTTKLPKKAFKKELKAMAFSKTKMRSYNTHDKAYKK